MNKSKIGILMLLLIALTVGNVTALPGEKTPPPNPCGATEGSSICSLPASLGDINHLIDQFIKNNKGKPYKDICKEYGVSDFTCKIIFDPASIKLT